MLGGAASGSLADSEWLLSTTILLRGAPGLASRSGLYFNKDSVLSFCQSLAKRISVTKTIQQSVRLPAAPDDLYDSYLDA
jgi:hypothetical protein